MAHVDFNCTMFVRSVTLAAPGSPWLFVVLRLDALKLETAVRSQPDPKSQLAVFNESFTFPLSLATTKRGFAEKKVTLWVYSATRQNRVKTMGSCSVDLAGMCGCSTSASLSLPLLASPDPLSHLDLDITMVGAGKAGTFLLVPAKGVARCNLSLQEPESHTSRLAPPSVKCSSTSLRPHQLPRFNVGTPMGISTIGGTSAAGSFFCSEKTKSLFDESGEGRLEREKEDEKQRRPQAMGSSFRSGSTMAVPRACPEVMPKFIEDNNMLEEELNLAVDKVYTESLVSCLKKQLLDREGQAGELTSRLASVTLSKEKLEGELVQTKSAIASLETAKSKTAAEKEVLEREAEALRTQLAKFKQDSNVRGEETENLRRKITELGEVGNKMAAEFAHSARTLQQKLATERDVIQQRLTKGLRVELAPECRERIQRLEGQLAACAKKMGALMTKQKCRNEARDTQTAKLKGELEKLRVGNEKLRLGQDLGEKSQSSQHVSSSADVTQAEIKKSAGEEAGSDVLRQQVKVLLEERAALKKTQAKQAQICARCVQDSKRMKVELARVRQEVLRQTQDAVKYKEEAKKAREEQKRQEEAFRSSAEQINDLKIRLADAELMRDRLQIKKKELEEAAAGKGNKVQILEAELVRVRQDLGAAKKLIPSVPDVEITGSAK